MDFSLPHNTCDMKKDQNMGKSMIAIVSINTTPWSLINYYYDT